MAVNSTNDTSTVATLTPFQQANGGAQAFQFGNGQGLNAQGAATPPPAPSVNSVDEKVTPIISANQAIDHYTNAQNFLNQTQQGVATQAQNKASQQAQNQAQTSQIKDDPAAVSKIPTADLAAFRQANPGTPFTMADLQKYEQAQPKTDNSDLVKALGSATDALNKAPAEQALDAGKNVTAPDKQAYESNVSKLNDQEGLIQTKLNDINTQITSSSDQFQQTVSQIQNGTFPLTPAQQALLTQTQTALQSLNQSAQQTAKLYAQAATTFGAVHGLSQFNPGAAQQAISAAMAKGQAEIAKTELEGTKQLADLQRGFQTDDFNMISKSYDALQKSLDAKQKIMTDLSTQIQKQITEAQTQYREDYKNYLTETQNAITNAFKSVSLTDTEKKNLFDQVMRSNEFDEKQKQDTVTNYYKGITASQNATRIGIEQQNANTALLKLQLDQSDAAKAASNALVKTLSGKTWVNGDGLDSKGEAAALDAGQKVLKGNNAKTMVSIGNIQQNINGLIKNLQDKNIFDKDGNPIGSDVPYTGLFSSNDQSNVNSNLKLMIPELQKLPNSADLITTLQNNQLEKNDTPQDLHNKITNITHALDDTENTILTNASQPQEGATGIINGQSATFTNGNWVTQ